MKFLLVFFLIFGFISMEIYAEKKTKTYSKKKNYKKRKKSSKKSSSNKNEKPKLSQEDIKFFHENWVIEETQFPSESIQSPTEVTNVNPTNKEDVPAKKIPVIPAKNEPNKIIAFFKEYKKAIIVSFIIIIFAIYKFRNGTSRSNTNLSGGMFSRLKDK